MKTQIRFLILLFFSFLFLIACSDNGTDPDENGQSFSGKITLEGQTDYSGVTVMLFNPVTIDTTLTNLNSRYPGVGIELNQQTEFHWWEHTPTYQTTTAGDGNWKIENVAEGTHHVVAKKDGFGWKVIFQAPTTENNIQLSPVIALSGIVDQDLVVEADKHVLIASNVEFNQGRTLTVELGSTFEFQNNAVLNIKGQVNIAGQTNNKILFMSETVNNQSKVILEQSNNSTLNNIVFHNVRGGLYIRNSNSLSILNSRFSEGNTGIEIFNANGLNIQNSVISSMDKGLLTTETNLTMSLNLLVNMSTSAVEARNEQNSVMTKNVLKNCDDYALSINRGGYAYSSNKYEIYLNDFINNANHILVATEGYCIVNNNNFVREADLIVNTSHANSIDTLDFKGNYWGYPDVITISSKIVDKLDRIGQAQEGPLVDIANYSSSYINWSAAANTINP